MRYLVLFIQLYKLILGNPKEYYLGDKKTLLRKSYDLITYLLRERENCSLYYAMGYDIKGTHLADYLGKARILKLRSKVDRVIKKYYGIKLEYDVATKDKFIAGSMLRANGFSCLDDLGLLINNVVVKHDGKVLQLSEIELLGDDLVLKNVVLESSEGVIFLKTANKKLFINDIEIMRKDLYERLSKGVWVIQRRYFAHEVIRRVNSTALNVIRIVTVLNGESIELLGGFQAFATGVSETDSWIKGSIYVGIDFDTSQLKEHGFRSPWHDGEGLLLKHPDSGIMFENFAIPYLRESADLCLRAHRLFYTSFLLGWDVAITDNGPVIVEVNEKPGMNVLQCTNYGAGYKLQKLADSCVSRFSFS